MVPQYTAIPAMGGGWPYKGMGLRGLMGKKTRQRREESIQKCLPEGSMHLLEVAVILPPNGYIKMEIRSLRRFTLIKYEKTHI